MPRDLHHTPSADPIDPLDAHADIGGEEGFEQDTDWSLPWPATGARADDPPSRPPKVWGAEPNLGRIWPVHTRPGGSTLH